MPHGWLLVSADRCDAAGSLMQGVLAVIVDLGDAVSVQGRNQTASSIVSARKALPSAKLFVRINALATTLAELDLDAVMPSRPDGIVLPDTIGGADLSRLGAMLAVREAETGLEDGATRIIAEVSSARGLFSLGSLAGVSRRLAGITWNPQALRRELGAQTLREPGGALADPYRVARGLTLLAAAAAGVPAIDAAFYDASVDPGGLLEESRAAQRDGFAAKLARDASEVRIIDAAVWVGG